jgi:hypothetical protein
MVLGGLAFSEVAAHRVLHHVLKLAQILALRGDANLAGWVILAGC